jgi:DNA-binding response OmpR family regulator
LREAVADCDLIVIETQHHLTPYQRQAIKWVRTGSMAPIVVLIGEKHPEDTIDIIKSGADAVIPLYLTSDAIAAHCQALVRRWRSHPYSSPKFA